MVNIIFLHLVFGVGRWKKQPYAGAPVFAVIFGETFFASASAGG